MLWWFAVPAVLVAMAVVAACSGSPGPLKADRRVTILEPKPGSSVSGPVTVRWRTKVDDGAAARWFVVYLDTSMAPPGTSSLLAASEPCATVADCLDRDLLDGPSVFLTAEDHVDLGDLLPGPHRITIVLVDADGIRDGAVAWNAGFRVE